MDEKIFKFVNEGVIGIRNQVFKTFQTRLSRSTKVPRRVEKAENHLPASRSIPPERSKLQTHRHCRVKPPCKGWSQHFLRQQHYITQPPVGHMVQGWQRDPLWAPLQTRQHCWCLHPRVPIMRAF